MAGLPSTDIACPYCGETITIFIDTSSEDQRYVEDCQVCCRPIEIRILRDEDDRPMIDARSQDEA